MTTKQGTEIQQQSFQVINIQTQNDDDPDINHRLYIINMTSYWNVLLLKILCTSDIMKSYIEVCTEKQFKTSTNLACTWWLGHHIQLYNTTILSTKTQIHGLHHEGDDWDELHPNNMNREDGFCLSQS
jgi:hypothetical protein